MPCSANDFSARTFFIGHHVRVAGCCQEGQGQVLLLDVRRPGKYRKGFVLQTVLIPLTFRCMCRIF